MGISRLWDGLGVSVVTMLCDAEMHCSGLGRKLQFPPPAPLARKLEENQPYIYIYIYNINSRLKGAVDRELRGDICGFSSIFEKNDF